MAHTEDHERADGRSLRLTCAEPDGVVRGGLVVLHDTDGVTEGIRDLMDTLAVEGWLTVAPHIDPPPAGTPGLSSDDVLAAADVTLAWLVGRGVEADLLGVVGFHVGGTAALVVASQRTVGATVTVGAPGITEPASAQLPALVDVAGTLTSPWLGIYGDAGDDRSGAEVERLREAADTANVATNVVRYPGANHRFDADPAAADEAWQRTLAWFDAHLR